MLDVYKRQQKLSYNILKLGIIKVRIETSCCEKFLMSSLLNDIDVYKRQAYSLVPLTALSRSRLL